MRIFREFYKVKNRHCTLCFYNIYFKQINLYQLKTLKMFNVSNPANAVVVGIIAIIATVSLLIWKFNFYLGIDIYTSGEVLFKTLLYAALIGLFSYYFRHTIKISNTVILSLPLFFLLYSAYSKLQNDAYHWKCTTVCNTSWARLNIAQFNDISMYIVGIYG